MTLNPKDRNPAFTGNRSFFLVKYIVAAVFIMAFLLTWYGSQIIVVIAPEDKQAVTFDTYIGDTWHIEFTHSVEKTPVKEYFTVNGVNDMTMTHTVFESFGWGFPYSPADGTISSTDDGKFKLIMNRPYQNIKMRVAVQARPCIIHNDKKYDLCGMFGQGTLVEVKVQQRYDYWLDKLL